MTTEITLNKTDASHKKKMMGWRRLLRHNANETRRVRRSNLSSAPCMILATGCIVEKQNSSFISYGLLGNYEISSAPLLIFNIFPKDALPFFLE